MRLQARQGIGHEAESLSAAERRIAHHTERVLLVMLFVIPPTGLVVLLGDDDLLGPHIAAHIVFFVALATHLGWSSAGGCADDPCCSAGCSSRRWWSSAELTSMPTRFR